VIEGFQWLLFGGEFVHHFHKDEAWFLSGQNHQKNSLKECFFVNSALKIQCHTYCQKYTLTDYFLPTGLNVNDGKEQIEFVQSWY